LADQIKDEMDEACGTYGVQETCIRVFVKKSERKRSLGRTEHRGGKIIQLNYKK
jgi:hypothetical protein